MARMRRAGLSIKPTTHRSCCAAHKKAQRSNHAKSAPARFMKKANRRDDECPANACCIGRYGRGLGICRTRYNNTVTISIGTPGPLPGQWQEVGPRKRPSFKRCRLSIPAFEPWECRALHPFASKARGLCGRVGERGEKIILFFVGLVWRRNGGFSSIGLAPISVIPASSRNPAAPRLRRERVSCDQGLDRTGPRLKAGVTEVPGRVEEAPATRQATLLNVAIDHVFQIFLTTGLRLRVDVVALDHRSNVIELQFAAQQLLGVGRIPLGVAVCQRL
ncbi:hypothetical protein DSM25558_4241 [Agrobacterium sp. DSM 25558]|nr:hypothetical protein DSM25558_4241 [Agrobacterium sp. DSM 25558]